jgi:hypothetical protein
VLWKQKTIKKIIAMKKNSKTPLIRALSTIVILFYSAYARGQSDGVVINVQLEAKPKPVKATGILFSATTTSEYQSSEIKMIGDKLYSVSFKVPSGEIRPDSLASAYGVDENGKVSYGSVRPVQAATAVLDIASIPRCKDANIEQIATITNVGTLRQLIDVRTQRMEIIRTKIKQTLNGVQIEKMRKFEEAFGLPHNEPLSATLPPLELYERLSRIQASVEKYKQFKN